MGAARFRVNRILRLSGRSGIFVCGDVLEGIVAAGMTIRWPLRAPVSVAYAPIASIDYLDVDRAGGKAESALRVRFEGDAEEMEKRLEDSFEVGMVVDVE